jgi:hypothetical protein
MKLTKQQLKRLIKEELFQEQNYPGTKNIILNVIKNLKQGNSEKAVEDLKALAMIESAFLISILKKGISQ